MNKLYNFTDQVIKLGAYLAGILIIITTVMVFYEVCSRAILGVPTSWATELSIYATIASAFLGSAYAVRTYAHITVDIVVNNVSDNWKTILFYITNSLGLLFSIILTIYGFMQVVHTYSLGTTSASLLRIPMFLPELVLPIGGLLLIAAFTLQLIDGGEPEGGEQL